MQFLLTCLTLFVSISKQHQQKKIWKFIPIDEQKFLFNVINVNIKQKLKIMKPIGLNLPKLLLIALSISIFSIACKKDDEENNDIPIVN